MSDPTQPGPVSLRISVTDRCQLRCIYCMPPDGVPKRRHHEILTFEEIVRFVRVVNSHFRLSKVHITGGEPLLRRGIVDLVAMLADEGISDLALTTNGLRLDQMASDLKRAGLCRVNVSLDSLVEKSFAALTRGGELRAVLAGIEAARREGLDPVKLNALVLRGYNDGEVTALAQWAINRGCCIRFLELMPIGCARSSFAEWFVPASEVRRRLEKAFILTSLPYKTGGSSRNFLATDPSGRHGTIGFITPETQPFCNGCRRLRLTSAGGLIPCLAHGRGTDVKNILRSSRPDVEQALKETIAAELTAKCARLGFSTDQAMVAVGG